ncbi:hypothetical protein CB0940_03489 [Cercospora beticola]|uniref:Chitin-binding type-1 domain-containing protein n=1 Tax=Cercospora beticola TaxID=122368 RepID=A0A2G5I1T4_CERBT|nr:hypothetical protein CB0940_03489 [Cercospora beticola]PIA98708.1 hypothetical protein CB0940_03489 [Cercospora beticola]WPB00663.1 hypothetical protein RHO25_005283 [Cercospora beticola]CAK1361101.1 unnamed protein product [Cercospora beticola]
MFPIMVLFLAFAGLLAQAAALPFLNSTTIHNCSEAASTHSIHARADLKVSDRGLCGGTTGQTCKDSLFGDACGQWGYCGSYYDAAYAGVGCQPEFGVCSPDFNNPVPSGNTTALIANTTNISSPAPSSISSGISLSANLSSASTLTSTLAPTGVVITPISVITVPLTTTVEVIKTVTVEKAQASGS